MHDRRQYTEWRGPDKPGSPGVHVVGYVTVLIGTVVIVTLWFTVGRLVMQYVAG